MPDLDIFSARAWVVNNRKRKKEKQRKKIYKMDEVGQVEVGLRNLQERLTAVQATLDATQRSLALFLDTQEALNLVRSFRSCPCDPPQHPPDSHRACTGVIV
jgi:hypothetical protein